MIEWTKEKRRISALFADGLISEIEAKELLAAAKRQLAR